MAEDRRGGGLPGSPEAGERSLVVAAYRQRFRQAGIEMPANDARPRTRRSPETQGDHTASCGNSEHAEIITAFTDFMQIRTQRDDAPENQTAIGAVSGGW